MRTVRYSLHEAAAKFQTVKSTLNLAKKVGLQISGHCCGLNKRGTINTHWLLVDGEWKRNEALKRLCRMWIESNERVAKQSPINPLAK